MPSEKQVRKLVRTLPKGTLIRGVVEYGWSGVTDTPLAFMLHAGIQLALLGMDYRVAYQLGTTIRANHYTFIVGPTSARKSTALRTITELVAMADGLASDTGVADAVMIDAASREGLIRLLGKAPKRLFLVSEGGDWLKLSAQKGYQAPMRGALTRAYDGDELRHEVKSVKSGLKPVKKHCMSMIMAATPSHIAEYTDSTEWEGGFMNRFGFCYAEQERDYSEPTPNPLAKLALAELVAERARWLQVEHEKDNDNDVNQPSHDMGAAKPIWADWSAKKKLELKEMTEGQREAVGRWATHALKLAMIASHDMGATDEPDWEIQEQAMAFATTVVDWCIADALMLYETTARSPYERMSNNVLAVMEDEASKGYTRLGFSDIARTIKPRQTKRVVAEILDSLIAERKVFMLGPEDAKYFSLDENDKDAPAEPEPDPEEVDWSYKGPIDPDNML